MITRVKFNFKGIYLFVRIMHFTFLLEKGKRLVFT